MSDQEAEAFVVQNGSQNESTNGDGSTIPYKSSQNSLQSNNSNYLASNYIETMAVEGSSLKGENNSNKYTVNKCIPLESVESRALQLLELAKTGALEELETKLITLIKENDELKERLVAAKSNSLQSQESNMECTGAEDSFCIDAAPSELDHSRTEMSMGQEMETSINYDAINGGEKLFLSGSKSENDTKNGKSSFTNSCFNCLGNHIISECKEPKDYKRINKNRRSFQSSQGVKSARYHVEEGQKFAHIQPGQCPSKSLLSALGLRDERYLPPYIYQMRKLGYPPAWLKYAQINPSGLSLYMARGTKLEEYVSDVNNGEEGEIAIAEDSKQEMEYDVGKLIGWPGFNIQPDKDYKEEHRLYRAPSLQLDGTTPKFESLDTMKKRLSAHQQKGYVRGEMQNTNVGTNLLDSEVVKKQVEPPPPGINSIENEDRSGIKNSPKFIPASVKSSDHGTPIVDNYSPYNELPTSDKWTCFTTDHIFFENLPESTGKYDNMVGILKKCRDAKKEIEKLAKNTTTSSDTTPSGS